MEKTGIEIILFGLLLIMVGWTAKAYLGIIAGSFVLESYWVFIQGIEFLGIIMCLIGITTIVYKRQYRHNST